MPLELYINLSWKITVQEKTAFHSKICMTKNSITLDNSMNLNPEKDLFNNPEMYHRSTSSSQFKGSSRHHYFAHAIFSRHNKSRRIGQHEKKSQQTRE
ncbi:hypothetical protein JTE90_011379 [Oedothorax gibbosus]|uniref:Uncharacterized protein n=1 Tax=Oedothorax gibbosus TaxID=931172 RepID=A0AAV6VMC0_9ARAC|nr:hypothetical protein JTE90_011379 [Oedothorax gibbosus]